MLKALLPVLYFLLGVLALYAAAMTWLWFRQERLMFFPVPLPLEAKLSRDADVHELSIPVDGANLSALHLRLRQPRGLVFFLHGNAGNLASWFVAAEHYRAANYDLFMLDYRGYGKSSGHIESEAQLRADVRAAWEQVAPAYRGMPVVIYGRSMGTALAAGLSAQLSQGGEPPAMTVLVSPYRSMAALQAHHYPFIPRALLRYSLRTEDAVGQVRGPLVMFHGLLDQVIPNQHSDDLAEAARKGGAQARVVKIEGAGHNDLQDFDSYLKAFFGALPR